MSDKNEAATTTGASAARPFAAGDTIRNTLDGGTYTVHSVTRGGRLIVGNGTVGIAPEHAELVRPVAAAPSAHVAVTADDERDPAKHMSAVDQFMMLNTPPGYLTPRKSPAPQPPAPDGDAPLDTAAIAARLGAFVAQWSADEHPPYVHADLGDLRALLDALHTERAARVAAEAALAKAQARIAELEAELGRWRWRSYPNNPELPG